MPRFVSRANLSRLAKVSDVAISKACKGQLAPACDGKRIDVDHPAVVAYLKAHGRKPPKLGAVRSDPPPAPLASRPRQDIRPPTPTLAGSDEDLEQLSELIQPLLERFGTELRFKDFLTALKTIEEIRGKRLDNEETEGRLVERELVRVHVFGAIEKIHRRLLSDIPKTLARTLYAAANSGVPLEVSEKSVRDQISTQLGPMKTAAARALRNA